VALHHYPVLFPHALERGVVLVQVPGLRHARHANKFTAKYGRYRLIIKTLWASVTQNPRTMQALNGWATIFWVAMVPVSLIFGWLSSVQYVSALSLWALVSGHLGAYQAARVEVFQQREAARDVPAEIVEKVIERLD
jgi:hypothetical protein